MKIEDFGVERWMDLYETRCSHNLSETCVDSLKLDELLAMTGRRDAILSELGGMRLSYGAIEGSMRLRTQVASLYETRRPEDILITHGAIGANALVHQALVAPGDRVICIVPTYQQHYSLPGCFGADVELLHLRESNGFLPDLDELAALLDRPTRLISLCNPNNPTGALMSAEPLAQLCGLAESAGAYVLCDEVYRGLDQDGDGYTRSAADLYERAISTGSMSKAYSLAGLRLGWIAGPPEVIRAVAVHRDYTTISVGMIDDYLAAVALEHHDQVMERNRGIVRRNLATLDAWLAREPLLSYVKPRSGTTALLKYSLPMPSYDLGVELVESTGVLLSPGSTFGMEGHLRIGYANAASVLDAGLEKMSAFFAGHAARTRGAVRGAAS